MIETILKDANERMQKTVDAMKHEFAKLRTGRAHPSLLDHVMVPYYGTDTHLSKVASVSVSDSRTLTVTPWEKNLVSVIEKAILTADLGLNPANNGGVIRVPVPALTEERRRDLTRVVKAEAETARVSIRNIRRDANTQVKALLKDKKINEDDDRRAEEKIQQLTDKRVVEIDKLVVEKEKDLMEI